MARLRSAPVYLEAGASDWEPARRSARQLRATGIAKVRGFALNATHQDRTRPNIRHGLAISRRVRGKPFVIDTAENERGARVSRSRAAPSGGRVGWHAPRALSYARCATSRASPPRGTRFGRGRRLPRRLFGVGR